ncbi:MAG: hypothetical protein ABJN35_11695 [Erythrobacter sp.]
MTNEEWAASIDATEMLVSLYLERPTYFQEIVPELHKFLIACCWKNKHLTPQKSLRDGLKGAEDRVAGKIDEDEFYRLNWHAEAAVFDLAYWETDTPEDVERIKAMIEGISDLEGMSFKDAREVMSRAAAFAETSMIYPWLRMGTMSKRPERVKIKPERWCDRLFRSEFLCPDLLRKHLEPSFPS